MIKLKICSYSIMIPLTDSQWKKLNWVDDGYIEGQDKVYDEFIKDMEALGCYKIDWNGHFGQNFFFDIDKMDYRKNKSTIIGYLDELLGE